MSGAEVEGSRAVEPRRRRPRRLVPTFLLLAVALAVAGAAIVTAATLGLRDELEAGRRGLEAGRRALLQGRVAEASDAFGDALRAFGQAEEEGGSLLASVAGRVPVLGRSVDVASAVADAGVHASRAGLAISRGLGELPGGVDALAPAGGALPVEAFSSLAEALEAASAEARTAARLVRASPDSWLPGPVRDARRSALEKAEELEHLLGSAESLARGLPGFAGVGEPRRYLFIAENPAELRGTGGIWGAYAIVRMDRGRFAFSPFRPIQELRDLPPERVPAPNPDYRRNYDQWGGAGYWLNMNMTPDFPSAARAALSAWEAIGREPLDGVLTADPFALRHLLMVTGTVRVPRPALAVNPGNVISLLSNRAFALFPDPTTRKAVLGEVARVVFGRFLELEGRAVPRLRAISRAVAEGHLKLYAVDPVMQGALERAGLDAGLRTEGTDLVGVIVNSASGSKVDYFAERSIAHEVVLLHGLAARASTLTTIGNGAPDTGQPRYVIGPHVGAAGDNIPLISVFCGEGCRLTDAARDGEPISVVAGSELGHPFFQDYFTIPSGETGRLEVGTETPGAWSGDALSGCYRLVVLGQTTIRPTDAVIRIEAPAGMRFTEWTDGIEIEDGGVAVWSGVLEDDVELSLSFRAPSLPVRVWRALTPF